VGVRPPGLCGEGPARLRGGSGPRRRRLPPATSPGPWSLRGSRGVRAPCGGWEGGAAVAALGPCSSSGPGPAAAARSSAGGGTASARFWCGARAAVLAVISPSAQKRASLNHPSVSFCSEILPGVCLQRFQNLP